MMADDTQVFRDRIEKLEFRLAEVLNKDAVAPLQTRYGLTRQQAALLSFLLDGKPKSFEAIWTTFDSPEATTKNHIMVQLHRIRKAMPWAQIKSIRCFGFQMEKETADRIKSEVVKL